VNAGLRPCSGRETRSSPTARRSPSVATVDSSRAHAASWEGWGLLTGSSSTSSAAGGRAAISSALICTAATNAGPGQRGGRSVGGFELCGRCWPRGAGRKGGVEPVRYLLDLTNRRGPTGFSDFYLPELSGPENRATMTRFVMHCRSDRRRGPNNRPNRYSIRPDGHRLAAGAASTEARAAPRAVGPGRAVGWRELTNPSSVESLVSRSGEALGAARAPDAARRRSRREPGDR
jgi:hypothetical protein